MTAREAVWESWLNADYRARYFGELAGRFSRYQRQATVLLAITSSGAFLALMVRISSSAALPWIVEIAALLAASIGWILMLGRFPEKANLAAAQHMRWARAQREYQELWLSVEAQTVKPAAATKRCSSIEESAAKMDEMAMRELPDKKRLALRCYEEMEAVRGVA